MSVGNGVFKLTNHMEIILFHFHVSRQYMLTVA